MCVKTFYILALKYKTVKKKKKIIKTQCVESFPQET